MNNQMRITFHLLIIAFLFLPLAPLPAQQVKAVPARKARALPALRKAVSDELIGPLFQRTLAAVEISDAANGTVLFSRNETLFLRPASNAKLFTSAAAVLGLPTDFRFETRLAVTDSAKRTLVCIGGGDPLSTAQDIQKLAEIAQHAGVVHIDTLLMDGTLFDADYFGSGWMWDDEPDPFMPYLSAFSINGNTATIFVKSSAKNISTLEFSTEPSSREFDISRGVDSGDPTQFRIERVPRSNDFIVHGSPRKGKTESEQFSIWRPQVLFADIFLGELRRLGIADDSVVLVLPASPISSLPLGEVGHSLSEVLAVMNKESDNLCAEAVLRALCYGTGRKLSAVSANDGLAAMSSIFGRNGISSSDIALRDGSGISFYNLVTAASIGRVLRRLTTPTVFERYRSSLSIAGVDGTLRNRMTTLSPFPAFRGKTGTVRGVSALSGYVQAPGGRLLTIVILMQNFVGKPSPYREVQDRIIKHCLDYSTSFKAVKQPR